MVDRVLFDSVAEGRNIKTIDFYRRRTEAQACVSASRNREMYVILAWISLKTSA
jgi:hypothetical protein